MAIVKLCQCLCPERHCIMACAAEIKGEITEAQLQKTLSEAIDALIRDKKINSHCGLCGAEKETFTFEVKDTPWESQEEAQPFLAAAELAQLHTAAMQERFPDWKERMKKAKNAGLN